MARFISKTVLVISEIINLRATGEISSVSQNPQAWILNGLSRIRIPQVEFIIKGTHAEIRAIAVEWSPQIRRGTMGSIEMPANNSEFSLFGVLTPRIPGANYARGYTEKCVPWLMNILCRGAHEDIVRSRDIYATSKM
ncbi:unnamed protein product, partial [Iphiclides podalirius]